MVDRRLGRGLDFFLSGGKPPPQPPPAPPSSGREVGNSRESRSDVIEVGIDALLASPFQPRKSFPEADLNELSASIRASGILQPLLVRQRGEKYEVVAGERRWRAAKLVGLTRVPVLVRSLSDQEAAVFALVENLQREDLNAIEKAEGFKRLLAMGATHEEVAHRVGLDRSTVTNTLRLLDLPEEVQAHVSRGTLSMGHARALLGLGDAELMRTCADQCLRRTWSVRALEARVKDLQTRATGAAPAKSKTRPVWLNELEESLMEALGTQVAIRYGRKNSQIVIRCGGREEFERIYSRLKNSSAT